MKTSLLLLAALSATAVAQDNVIPASYSKDRYAEMAKSSPFIIETKVEPQKAEKVDPFANIVLRGLGSDFVVIQRHGDDQTIRLVGEEENQGFKVVKINWSDVPGGSTVDLIANGESGTVKFDANLRNPPAPVNPAPGGQPPGFRRPVSGPQPITVPQGATLSVPRPPTVAGSQIPRPTMQAQPQGGQRQFGNGQRQFGNGGQPGGQPQGGYRGGGTQGAGTQGAGGDQSGRTRVRDIRNR